MRETESKKIIYNIMAWKKRIFKRIKRTWKHNYNRKDFIEVVDSDGSICHILKPKKPEKILWK